MEENKRLLTALGSEPEFNLRAGFADRVMYRIQLAEARKVRVSWWLQMAIGTGFGVLGLIVLLIFGGSAMTNFLGATWPWIVITVTLIVTFQYADQRLVLKRKGITYTFSDSLQ